MGTEVLRPQDLLVERFHVPPASFQRRRNYPGGHGNLANLTVNRKPNHAGQNKKKKFNNTTTENAAAKKVNHAETTRRKHDVATTTAPANGGPVMGQVTLLRRGESLDSFETSRIKGGYGNHRSKSPRAKPVDDLAVLGIGRIGPESPEMLPKQIRFSAPPLPNNYAGSAFSMSPSPQSLPLPSFFSKKQQIDDGNDPATRDLRRMLRLE